MEVKTFKVLCIDGGGMRGVYTAAYLASLAQRFAHKRGGMPNLDIGAAFNLIVGTSTGGILACSLAAGIEQNEMVELYKKHGKAIFPENLPQNFLQSPKLLRWPRFLEVGNEALRKALTEKFGDTTLAEIYARRGIGLSIPAVEMSRHHSWVFKTPHIPANYGRDDQYTLVDVCMATSAAPIYRSMAYIDNPDSPGGRVFVDGGLWANSPVLVGLIDALTITDEDDNIEIYCLGTCSRPAGEQISESEIHRSIPEWKFGGGAVALSLDAQEFAFHNMARLLTPHLKRNCKIIKFPTGNVPADVMQYLDLDETRDEGLNALISQANRDVDETLIQCSSQSTTEGEYLKTLFDSMPALEVALA